MVFLAWNTIFETLELDSSGLFSNSLRVSYYLTCLQHSLQILCLELGLGHPSLT